MVLFGSKVAGFMKKEGRQDGGEGRVERDALLSVRVWDPLCSADVSCQRGCTAVLSFGVWLLDWDM